MDDCISRIYQKAGISPLRPLVRGVRVSVFSTYNSFGDRPSSYRVSYLTQFKGLKSNVGFPYEKFQEYYVWCAYQYIGIINGWTDPQEVEFTHEFTNDPESEIVAKACICDRNDCNMMRDTRDYPLLSCPNV